MLIPPDVAGVLLVYIYVGILLIFTEKILDFLPTDISRKILHIMVGNIAFLLPIFQTRWIMAFLAAGPFILFTFLMSPYSPIKSIRGKTSSAGHGFGLVYYAIAWTILAYIFFDYKVLISIGILAMSYGDGFASILGSRYGKHRYNVWGDEKSFIGSISMFVFTLLTVFFALFFYDVMIDDKVVVLLYISVVATFIEGVSPKGLDNLSVPFITPILYWFYIIW
ncbi:MAG: phosphatidate cytidylyltransferase [Candidatus Thermoplasmatota archaeon]